MFEAMGLWNDDYVIVFATFSGSLCGVLQGSMHPNWDFVTATGTLLKSSMITCHGVLLRWRSSSSPHKSLHARSKSETARLTQAYNMNSFDTCYYKYNVSNMTSALVDCHGLRQLRNGNKISLIMNAWQLIAIWCTLRFGKMLEDLCFTISTIHEAYKAMSYLADAHDQLSQLHLSIYSLV